MSTLLPKYILIQKKDLNLLSLIKKKNRNGNSCKLNKKNLKISEYKIKENEEVPKLPKVKINKILIKINDKGKHYFQPVKNQMSSSALMTKYKKTNDITLSARKSTKPNLWKCSSQRYIYNNNYNISRTIHYSKNKSYSNIIENPLVVTHMKKNKIALFDTYNNFYKNKNKYNNYKSTKEKALYNFIMNDMNKNSENTEYVTSSCSNSFNYNYREKIFPSSSETKIQKTLELRNNTRLTINKINYSLNSRRTKDLSPMPDILQNSRVNL